jgi:tRNA-modifying protein YgfZ
MKTLLLGKRTLIAASGKDLIRYLNGQVTNDVKLLFSSEKKVIPACVTNAKGKLQAYVHLYKVDDEIWIEAPIELRDFLLTRLERYLIADEVVLRDISDQFVLTHHIEAEKMDRGFENPRLGVIGYDEWISPDNKIIGNLSLQEAETIRISHGIPACGKELIEGVLPPEAGLGATTISYSKGCYIGQEVISRMKSAGKVNRRLTQFTLNLDLNGSEKYQLLNDDHKVVGHITSVSFPHALGFVAKSGFELHQFHLQKENGEVIENAATVIL